MYRLIYMLGGQETTEEVNANNHANLAEYVTTYVVEQTGNPDACFTLKDFNDNTIFTEENTI